MAGEYVVWKSKLIVTEREARQYYQQRLGGLRIVRCAGRDVTLFFDGAANHVYTIGLPDPAPPGAKILRHRIGPGVYDERIFSLDRALLIDQIIPAVKYFTFSLPGTGAGRNGSRLLHGPRLADGRYLRVVLAPGPRGHSWMCKSAYPIAAALWMTLRKAKTAKFP